MPLLQRGSFSTYFEDSGSGPPVVLICGLSGELQAWRFQVPELSKHRRVISFDNRGAGRTSAPDEPYSVALMADDLRALLDHLEIERADILGWSMGGVIAQTFTLAHPHRVGKLLLLATFAAPDGYLRSAVTNWVNMRRSNMTYEQTVRYLARMVWSPMLVNNADAFEKVIQTTLANPFRQTDVGFFRQVEAMLAYEEPTNLSSIAAPTAVLLGEYDQLVPPYLSRELAAKIPGATLRVLPGAHAGFIEQPAPYNEALLNALASPARSDA